MEYLKHMLKVYINNNLVNEYSFNEFIFENSNLDLNPKNGNFIKKESNIQDFINDYEQYNDFQTLLFKLIDDRNLKDSEVYNKVHIDRRLFSKIRSDKNYHPSKETIILLAIALELSEDELIELLDSASYSLPKNNNYDLIIRFCFINKIFKLSEINELLNEYKCKLFSY